MKGRIPENILEEILGRVNIVELISAYIPLKRAGRNFKANCPFHHEKTPSFMVSPERQIYHCFGCGQSGNAFKFLMEYEHLDFLEAVELLAKKSGTTIPERHPEDKTTTSFYQQLYRINDLTALFYKQALKSDSSKHAKGYVAKRGIDAESLELFGIGFAPEKWDALIDYMRSKNVSLDLLEKAGLIIPKENGGYYDRFRNRIIFPIQDLKSRFIGFGARLFAESDKSGAKYMNSPETPVYTKGRNLYGLNFAKDAIRERDSVVIVEGYLDFIIPYQYGIKNLVASCGTTLTSDQVALLKRYTNNAVIVYDADNAGQMATLRSLDIFIEEAMDVRIVSLPKGLDPDLFVRKNGPDAFQKLIAEAKDLFDYKLDVLKSRHNEKDIRGKTQICSEMLPTLNRFKNAILKSGYVKKLSEDLGIPEESILQELRKLGVSKTPIAQANTGYKKPEVNPTEKLLIKLMLEEKEFIGQIRQHLDPGDFHDEKTSKLVSVLFDLFGQGKDIDPSNLINYFDDDESMRFICESSISSEETTENRDRVLEDCIRRLKSRRLSLMREQLQNEIKFAEKNKDYDKLDKLTREVQASYKNHKK